MTLGWQVLLSFLFGVFLTIILFIVLFRTVRWIILSVTKGMSLTAKSEMSKAKKEIKEHFGIKDRED